MKWRSAGTLQQNEYLAFRSRTNAESAASDPAPLMRWNAVVATASAN